MLTRPPRYLWNLWVSCCAAAGASQPLETTPEAIIGTASWYGEAYRGKRMANGARFNPDALTCATYRWPLGATLKVTHEGRSVMVIVTDRGPAIPLGRLIDLSQAAFAQLAPLSRGLLRVQVVELFPAHEHN